MDNKDDLIREEFKRVFKEFSYPYKTSNQLIAKMTIKHRQKYFKKAGEINDSEVMIQELNEICRLLYYQLAVETKKGDENELLYKGALLFASRFKKRFNELSLLDPIKYEEKIEKLNQELNNFIPQ